jgi:hypothetical protein
LSSKEEIVFTHLCEFFYAAFLRGIFLFITGGRFIMEFKVIEIQNESMALAYAIARVVYAETLAKSLRVVEALTSMISNVVRCDNRNIKDVISDKTLFESLNSESNRHKFLSVDASRRDFQMCVRVAQTMQHGCLPDMCNHATRFHRDELLPEWALARGYVADIDGILFYA